MAMQIVFLCSLQEEEVDYLEGDARGFSLFFAGDNLKSAARAAGTQEPQVTVAEKVLKWKRMIRSSGWAA